MRYVTWCFGLLMVAGAVAAADVKTQPQEKADAEGKVVLDNWDAAYIGTSRAGYVRTVVREVERDGKKRFRTLNQLHLKVARFKDVVTLEMESGTEEDEEGKVTVVFMKQLLGKGLYLLSNGTVKGKRLHVVYDEDRNGTITRKIDKENPWNDAVRGLYWQERQFRERKVKAGDAFDFQTYEPTINHVIKVHVTVKEPEEVELRGRKRKLLHVEAQPEKLVAQNGSIDLPAMVAWVDDDYRTQRSVMELPGIGKFILYRGTREQALGGNNEPVAKLQDIGLSQLIHLNRAMPNAYDATDAVYRITIKDDKDPTTAFVSDARQTIKNVNGNTFDLHVHARRRPAVLENPIKPRAEFLKSCYFINGDDAKVKAHAATAVAEVTDPWKKALLIEAWVHDNMQNKNFTEAFATASQAARTLEGDCTEHAMLAAAMCRAAGVPSRTALGLVYVNTRASGGPCMGFHMWTEVGVGGQWMPIDATLGRGFVGASHVKITDHSWTDTQTLTPVLPVIRVVGKVSIEVIKVGAD